MKNYTIIKTDKISRMQCFADRITIEMLVIQYITDIEFDTIESMEKFIRLIVTKDWVKLPNEFESVVKYEQVHKLFEF